jgi:hypothetical protein
MKPFFGPGEAGLKHAGALITPDQTTGCDHVNYSQRYLRPIHGSYTPWYLGPEGKGMIEIFAACAALFSIGIFLAQAFDVWRTF